MVTPVTTWDLLLTIIPPSHLSCRLISGKLNHRVSVFIGMELFLFRNNLASEIVSPGMWQLVILHLIDFATKELSGKRKLKTRVTITENWISHHLFIILN